MPAEKNKILRKGRGILLAYDQGFEHGPTDFNDENVDPNFILRIAKESGCFTGIVLQEGIAEGYYPIGGVEKSEYPPLVLKLNGKTSFHKDEEPYSPQLCTVDEAVRLGATAVGYTIYTGSEHEGKMMQEFSKIEDEAHAKGLIVIAWMYPRGKHVLGRENSRDVVAYAARLALELGADFAKLPYTGDVESFKWVIESAGKTGVFVQGGVKKGEGEFLEEVRVAMAAGAVGMAVGRNIWQSEDPVGTAKKVAEIVYGV